MKKSFLLVLSIVSLSMIISCGDSNREKAENLSASFLPGINSFLNQHPEYGSAISAKGMPDWADGKRQQVVTNKGTYLFYTHNDEVVGVWREIEGGGREQIFHKEIPSLPLPKDVKRKATEELPDYNIIDQTKLITGGKYGDILITSFSKDTPLEIRESVLRRIAKKEGFTEASLYCTMDAYKANWSSSFAKAYPNALKEGCLGYLKDGKFSNLY